MDLQVFSYPFVPFIVGLLFHLKMHAVFPSGKPSEKQVVSVAVKESKVTLMDAFQQCNRLHF